MKEFILKYKMANDADFGTSIIGVNVVTGTNLPSRNPIILVLG